MKSNETPITDYRELLIIATEGFIRRAVATGKPFMLKGSYLTRQYYKDPSMRLPADLDWVYLTPIHSEREAEKIFDTWLQQVLHMDQAAAEGVKQLSIAHEKAPWGWGLLEYSIRQDFPTVNTDLSFTVDGWKSEKMRMDISYNIHVDDAPVPLLYQPLRGEPFMIPHTAPLSLQVSWKLHQTVTYARFKDIFDLIHLLEHPSFDAATRQKTVDAFMKECMITEYGPERIILLFTQQLEKLFVNTSDYDRDIAASWKYWRHNWDTAFESGDIVLKYEYEVYQKTTTEEHLPEDLETFKQQFYDALDKAGLTMELIAAHPLLEKMGRR